MMLPHAVAIRGLGDELACMYDGYTKHKSFIDRETGMCRKMQRRWDDAIHTQKVTQQPKSLCVYCAPCGCDSETTCKHTQCQGWFVGGGGSGVGMYKYTDPLPEQKALKRTLCWLISKSNSAPNREARFPKEKHTLNCCVLCLDLGSISNRKPHIL